MPPNVLLPIKKPIKDGSFALWPNSYIAVLPVLVAHEDRKTRLSFPSIDRVAVLAGISKTSAVQGVDTLCKGGWFERTKIPAGPHVRSEYRAIYPPYREDPKKWVSFPANVIFKGVWGVMPSSVKKLFLVLRALSWQGWMGYGYDDCYSTALQEAEHVVDGPERYVPIEKIAPSYLNEVTGLPARTRLYAWDWLLNCGLIAPTNEDNFERDGLWLTDSSNYIAETVLERLESIKRTPAAPSKGAKRSLSRARTRSVQKAPSQIAKKTPESGGGNA